jgi:hypothetical protein
MARQDTWTNADGLSIGFGRLDSKNPNASTVRTQGNLERMSMVLDWDQLPPVAGAPSAKSIPIPANSLIHRATLRVIQGFTSGGSTTMSIGLKNAAGTAIAATGIDATIAKTAMDTAGEVVQCDGSLVGGTATIGAADGYITTTIATGPYESGRAELVIEYSKPLADTLPADPIDGIVGSL